MFIIDLNLTVPVGTINGLIFYDNVVKIYERIFFLVVPFQFLLSSFSGLILILVFKFVSLMMWILLVRYGFSLSFHLRWVSSNSYHNIVWCSSKIVCLVGRQVIPVLATMILLLHQTDIYVQSSRSSITPVFIVLMTNFKIVIDANVQFAGGCHLTLFLLSLAVLIFSSWAQRLSSAFASNSWS